MSRQSPLVMLLVAACVFIAAITSIFFWTQSRNRGTDPLAEQAAEQAAEQPAGDTAVVSATDASAAEATDFSSAGRVAFSTTVEGMQVELRPRTDSQVQLAGPVGGEVVVPPPADTTEQQPTAVPPTPTPPPAEPVVEQPPAEGEGVVQADPLPTAPPAPSPTPLPTAEPVVVPVQPNPTPTAAGAGQTAVAGTVNANQPPIITQAYVVQAGDTMYSVGNRLGSSVELMAENGISSDDFVVNNSVQVPIANPAYCPNMRVYVVREADTVYRIGVRFNVDKDVIRTVNNLDAAYSITATQVLCIP